MIRHIVFFTLKDPAQADEAVARLRRLREIPGSAVFDVQRNRKSDRFGNDIDIVVYAEFPGEAGLDAYRAHPVYAEVTAIVRPMRELRFAADIDG